MLPSEMYYRIHQHDHEQRLQRSAQRQMLASQIGHHNGSWLRRIGSFIALFFL